MEIRQYLSLVRKWALLLVIGLLLGGAGTYIYSSYQPMVYQTQTKVMIMSSPEERGLNSAYAYYNDSNLIRTYSQLINTAPVLAILGERLGYPVSAGQISIKQVQDALLLELTVRDGDPTRAAEIANTLVSVFIEYNETLTTSRFEASETTLQAQIQQVKDQIDSLQAEMTQVSQESLITQQQQVETQMAQLDTQMAALKSEIASLTPPTPMPPTPTATVARGAVAPTAITPDPTATPDARKIALLEAKQKELGQLQARYDLYEQVYLNLSVLGEPSANAQISGGQQNQMQTTLALYQQIYTNLLNNYENIRLARLRSTPNVVQIEPAPVPGSPVSPQPQRDSAMGAVAGLLVMGAIAFLVEYLDDTLKTPEDVNRLLGLPVIGLIGQMERNKNDDLLGVYVSQQPRSPIAEAFRTLRTNLDFAGVDKPIKSLLITSSSPSEGKSTLAINLAAVMAQGERKVVLVDGDLRRPTLHRYLRVPNRTGLSDVFRHQLDVHTALVPWNDTNLSVLPSGAIPPNPTELLGSERMCEILRELESSVDIVIFDGPPFVVADPIVLSSRVDAVLVVIEPGKTKIDAAQTMLEQLNRAGARVVGAVLNPITRSSARYYSGRYRYYSEYYYSRSYGYYALDNDGAAPSKNGSRAKKDAGNTILPKKSSS